MDYGWANSTQWWASYATTNPITGDTTRRTEYFNTQADAEHYARTGKIRGK